ncbi:hypothetical protein ACLJYM_14610 [Rhizobium giardinii]|uniref:hypothetical protein n=1 Tax=Rhizobium giardinii TaxID=56731 RepID=UPI0039DF4998
MGDTPTHLAGMTQLPIRTAIDPGRRASSEAIQMAIVRLACFEVARARDVSDELVSVHANWANKVGRFPISHLGFKRKNDVSLACLKHRVSSFLSLELVLTLQLAAQRPQRVTELYVHYVSSRQLASECIQKLGCFVLIWRLIGREKLLDQFSCRRSLAGHSQSARRQCYCTLYLRQVHRFYSPHNDLQSSKVQRWSFDLQADMAAPEGWKESKVTEAGRLLDGIKHNGFPEVKP